MPDSMEPCPERHARWSKWKTDAERTFTAVVTVVSLLQQRDAETASASVCAAVNSMAQLHVDDITLQLFSQIHPSFFRLEQVIYAPHHSRPTIVASPQSPHHSHHTTVAAPQSPHHSHHTTVSTPQSPPTVATP